MKHVKILSFFAAFQAIFSVSAKDSSDLKRTWDIPAVKINFNQTGSRSVQFHAAAQVWTRFNESNPGTVVENIGKPYTFDIGLRRLRLWAIAQPLEWMTLAVQGGVNNFNAVSARKTGFFIHDAYVQFSPVKHHFQIGAGLVSSMGHARYSSPSVTSTLLYDAPLYQQSTNDVNDQFLRKLSVYAKGRVSGFDYRVAVSDPFSIKNSTMYDSVISQDAKFTPVGKSLQYSGYFQWKFFDKEEKKTPYFPGTYLGAKKVVNVGLGAVVQPRTTWNLTAQSDTVFNTLFLASADVFADLPLRQKKDDCLSLYTAYSYADFGKGYVRNMGVMNPASAINLSSASFNGTGNAYPMIGSGHTIYFQAGYKLPSSLFGKSGFSIQPVFDIQSSKFGLLKSWANAYNVGLNFLLVGSKAKISLNYQNRPIFDSISLKKSDSRNAVILQWQIAI